MKKAVVAAEMLTEVKVESAPVTPNGQLLAADGSPASTLKIKEEQKENVGLFPLPLVFSIKMFKIYIRILL